ncbi:hypothetical protein [Cystobacter fuscus]|uniref:SitA5 family polymorphic toxin n=1 Tax=Cystobacter fuscus TaxID=43 RepID=UPI0037C1B28F
MSTRRLVNQRPWGTMQHRTWGGWLLPVLFLESACVTAPPRGSGVPAEKPSPAPAIEYTLDVLEPGAVSPRPVPIPPAEFQRALRRLSRDVRLTGTSARETARTLLNAPPPPEPDVEHLDMQGQWLLEHYGGRSYTFVPLSQTGPVPLSPEAEEALKVKYLRWCERRGGGDCLGLLEDGPHLRAEDRRTLALALAFGPVLDETRAALGRELLDVRALVSLIVWTVALYCAAWVVPEPTSKALAAGLTVILLAWLGVETVWGLMDGYSRMAVAAREATTFEELRAAGEGFGQVLGEDAARTMILAVTTLGGRTLGEMAARVKSLPGHGLAGARWKAQGGSTVLEPGMALSGEEALAQAVATVEGVAMSARGPLAVVMLKQGRGKGPGGGGSTTVIRHRGGNVQVELANGQRWHLPRGKSLADIPTTDKVGDQLQEAVTQAAREWGPGKLTPEEKIAIQDALDKGKYWLARLLEREARGRFVEGRVSRRFGHLYDFNRNRGVDVIDPKTGARYEILSGTESNMARHGRRMAGEFFRMLTF